MRDQRKVGRKLQMFPTVGSSTKFPLILSGFTLDNVVQVEVSSQLFSNNHLKASVSIFIIVIRNSSSAEFRKENVQKS